MTNIYIKKPEVVRAVRLEQTADSMGECFAFISGPKVHRVTVDADIGILIELLDKNWHLHFGEYIVKDTRGEFSVLTSAKFEDRYTKVVTGEFKEGK